MPLSSRHLLADFFARSMPKQYLVDCITSTHSRTREGNRRISEALIKILRMTGPASRARSSRADAGTTQQQGRPIPIRPEQRFVFLSESSTPLTRAGFDNAWQDLIHAAIDAKAIAIEQGFTLDGLKPRGIIDTKGRRAHKKEASGHKSESMLDLYDRDVAIAECTRRRNRWCVLESAPKHEH
jgi:hypothetical protein